MISLSTQRAFFVILVSAAIAFSNCSSSEPKTDETKSEDKASTEVNQRRVENIDVSDPSKVDSTASGEKKVGCIEGDCVNGSGKYVYENGDVYTGFFKNDLRDGKGNFDYTDGEKFIGTYVEDKRQGAGEYIFKNGDKYLGEFKAGQINGKGIYTFSDGKALDGNFQNDGLDGTGTLVEGGTPKECKVAARKLLCD
jgi:hypothetical protein